MIENWHSRFADNVRAYEGYSIGKLFMLLRDPEIISLAGGLPSPELFLKEEMRSVSERLLSEDIERTMQYTPVAGEDALIEAIRGYLEGDAVQVSREHIVVTSSGQQGLDIVGRLLLNPGDTLLVDRPTFAGAIVAFEMQRPQFVGLDLQEDGSDVEGMREKIEALRAKNRTPKFVYVVPDFQNPSGITMSLQKRKALLDLSHEEGIPIVEDSPYRHLRYYGDNPPSLFSLDRQKGGGNVIGVYTFSKLFCPGMRIGFNIGPESVIEKMTNIKEGSTLNSPKYNQDICAAFLREMGWESYVRRCRDYYREKLDLFLETMAACFPSSMGVRWTEPEGGLFVWVTLPEHIDTMRLFHEAIKFKVAFVPGSAFYGENPEHHHMRINFSYPSKEQLREGIKRLARCVGRCL